MARSLTLELEERLYDALSDRARRQGRSPEDVGAAWLAAMIERAARDPVMRLSGSLDSGTPDLGARHDAYVADDLEGELRDDGR